MVSDRVTDKSWSRRWHPGSTDGTMSTMRIEGSPTTPAALLSVGRGGADSPGPAPSEGPLGATGTAESNDERPRVLPPIKVLVTMIERLTGRPVRLVDATDLPSLSLESPPPERPPALSSRPDWGVSLGVMDRGALGTGADETTVRARATVAAPDGAGQDLSMSIALSSRFVADQRARVRDGVSPLSDPLLVSFGGALDALHAGTNSFGLDVDPHSGIGRLTPTESSIASMATARGLATAGAFDPGTNIGTVMAVSTAVANSARPLFAPRTDPATSYRPVPDRDDAIKLDVSV
jgi:hypothetical protein